LVNVVLVLSLSVASGRVVTVDFNTADNPLGASSATDYVAAAGTVTFTPGVSTAALTMQTRGDKVVETDETFFLNLANPVNASLATSQATITILDDDGAVSIGDVTVVEGNALGADAVFTVTLNKPASSPVTMTFVTSNVSAVAGTDYTATAGSLTFAPQETVKTITVRVQSDLLDEANETFQVSISNLVNAFLADGIGLGTITDDDASPTISISPAVSVDPEGDAGATSAIFLVTLSTVAGQQVAVQFNTADGPAPNGATAGADYSSTSGVLTFLPGITQQSIAVSVNGDTLAEPNETFLVNLVNPVNAALGAVSQGTATIVDDEPQLTINDVTVTEPDAGSVSAVFTVALSRTSTNPITVAFTTAGASAVAGQDFTPTSGTLTFLPGDFQKAITVSVLGDAANEAAESYFVNLSAAGGAVLGDSQGVGGITDNDPFPTISIADSSRTEGNSGPGAMPFTVTLSNPSGQQVTVRFATANSTATAGSDFSTSIGTLTFAPGVTVQSFNVNVIGDANVEPDEVFFVNLSNAVNGQILDGQAQGTILDDEAQLGIADVSVIEGNLGNTSAVFTLTLSKVVGSNVTVNFAAADGTAVAPADYLATTGTVTFSPGQTTARLTVSVVGDTVNEGNETFAVNLTGASGASLGDSQAIGTITDDELPPAISIQGVAVAEGNAGVTVAVLNVSLDSPSSRQVTVNFSTSNGSATAGLDYNSASGVLTFVPGQVINQITVQVLGDSQAETSESFQVTLSNPVNAVLAAASAGVVINDDDAAPLLVTGAGAGGGPHVRAFNSVTGQQVFNAFAYSPGFTGGVRVATADMNGDGQADIITVPGSGGGPHLRVFDGRNGAMIVNTFVFEGSATGGLNVAAGDVNGDGRADLIIGTENGGGARVRIINGASVGGPLTDINNFSFPATTFQSGARVGAGDVNGDGRADVILGAAAGGTPRVIVLDGVTSGTIRDFFAYVPSFGGGVYVAAADFDGDGRAEILTGAGPGGGPHVRAFSGANGAILREFYAYHPGFTGGVRVGSVDANGDGRLDFLLAPGAGGGPHVKVLDFPSLGMLREFFAYHPGFAGGVYVAGAKLGATSGSPLLAASGQAVASVDTPVLTDAQLQGVRSAAIDRWRAAGVDDSALDRLNRVDVRVADLANGYLGLASPSAVYIDINAAGHGWFIDVTPDADEEFLGGLGSGEAGRRVDLLSAVMHELGHVLGLDDLDGSDEDDDLMYGLLEQGVRRTPALSAVESVFSGDWQ
jgi:hypothetical protein